MHSAGVSRCRNVTAAAAAAIAQWPVFILEVSGMRPCRRTAACFLLTQLLAAEVSMCDKTTECYWRSAVQPENS